MVPYSAFMTLKKTQGLNEITRYNLYNSSAIRGAPATGYSSGDAIKAIQEVAAKTLAARLRHRLGRSLVRRGEARERGASTSS